MPPTIVHLTAGRHATLDALGTKTVGHIADECADAAYGPNAAGEFSLKVDGVVLTRGVRASTHIEAESVVELVDITGYDWPANDAEDAKTTAAAPADAADTDT